LKPSRVDAFIEDIDNLMAEAQAPAQEAPPPPPDPQVIATTLKHLSRVADRTGHHARRLGTNSALAAAGKEHDRAANAAEIQGVSALGNKHFKAGAELDQASKTTADEITKKKKAKLVFGPQNPKDGGALSQILKRNKKNRAAWGSKDVAALPVAPGTSPSAPAR
jgi:hypothetical protein